MTHRHRLSSRILLFDEDGRVLLFLTKAPATSGFARWITPGGGVDPGEDHGQAAVRELREETGLRIESAGDPVWTHDFVVTFDAADHDTGHAEFYVQRTRQFVPSNAEWTPEEHVDVLAHRWWSIDELLASGEQYEPAELPNLIRTHLPSTNREIAMSRNLPSYSLEDLDKVARIELPHFSKEDAYVLGTIAAGVIQERGVNLAVDIVIGDDLVFRAKLGTTGKGNDEWLAGKAAAAVRYGEPSLLVRRRHELDGITEDGLAHDGIKAHGGSIPLFVSGELVATITMSGEPDVLDHETNAEAVNRYLTHIGVN